MKEITAENGKVTKAKDTRKKSQQMRSWMMKLWRENNIVMDFEEFHDKLYNEMMKNLPDTINKLGLK